MQKKTNILKSVALSLRDGKWKKGVTKRARESCTQAQDNRITRSNNKKRRSIDRMAKKKKGRRRKSRTETARQKEEKKTPCI